MARTIDDDDDGPTLKARPRGRVFELSSAPPSAPSTPPSDAAASSPNAPMGGAMNSTDGTATPSRTRSILNLTSSTLFGIYQPTGYATDREEPSTPWGTGAETPFGRSRQGSFADFADGGTADTSLQNGGDRKRKVARRGTAPLVHHPPRRGLKGYVLPLVGRVLALFGIGVLYGLLISHLHDRQEIAPVKVEGLDHQSWPYLVAWGVAGVLLGEALPRADQLWAPQEDDAAGDAAEPPEPSTGPGLRGWTDVVRSIGTFVGVAFAIRKLPWQSTMQLSLTLALANPALWYLIDRSPAGFVLSTAVSLAGTAVLLVTNPALVPPPSPEQALRGVAGEDLVLGTFSQESIGVATWIASVLFVSSVCFGNIGRRLA